MALRVHVNSCDGATYRWSVIFICRNGIRVLENESQRMEIHFHHQAIFVRPLVYWKLSGQIDIGSFACAKKTCFFSYMFFQSQSDPLLQILIHRYFIVKLMINFHNLMSKINGNINIWSWTYCAILSSELTKKKKAC